MMLLPPADDSVIWYTAYGCGISRGRVMGAHMMSTWQGTADCMKSANAKFDFCSCGACVNAHLRMDRRAAAAAAAALIVTCQWRQCKHTVLPSSQNCTLADPSGRHVLHA